MPFYCNDYCPDSNWRGTPSLAQGSLAVPYCPDPDPSLTPPSHWTRCIDGHLWTVISLDGGQTWIPYTDLCVPCECDATTYECVAGTCYPQTGGAYASLAECQTACYDDTDVVTCDTFSWPRYLCVTISGTCPEFGDPVAVIAEYHPPEVSGFIGLSWRVDASGDGWSVSGYIHAPCDPAAWAAGACPGPVYTPDPPTVHFSGGTFCESWFAVAYSCHLYSNQDATVADPGPPLEIHIDLYGGMFSLDAVPLSGACAADPGSGPGSGAGSCPDPDPATLCGTWTNKTGDCVCLSDFNVHNSDPDVWTDTFPDVNFCGASNPSGTATLTCDGTDGTWQLSLLAGMATVFVSATNAPLTVVFDVKIFNAVICTGAARLTFTEGACVDGGA